MGHLMGRHRCSGRQGIRTSRGGGDTGTIGLGVSKGTLCRT